MTVLYYYDDEDGVDFKFRAVSADPYLQENFSFMALDGPSAGLVGEGAVPGVQGMLMIDEENPSPRVFNFAGLSSIHYREVVNTLLQFFPERYQQYVEDEKKKEFKRQNPTKDEQEAVIATPREFGEITNLKDWEDKCKIRKACAIGLLPTILNVSPSDGYL